MSSWWIDLFIIIYYSFLSLVVFFGLKSILSGMSMATPAFFWLLFAWSIIFHPFTFILFVSLELRWVSWKQHMIGYYPATLCLLICEFNPFTFRVIIDRGGLSTAILSFVFWLLHSFFFLLFLSAILVLLFSVISSQFSRFFMFHASVLCLCFAVTLPIILLYTKLFFNTSALVSFLNGRLDHATCGFRPFPD